MRTTSELGSRAVSEGADSMFRIDDLLLDICTDFQVPREAIDQMITIASPTVLCHILNVGNLVTRVRCC